MQRPKSSGDHVGRQERLLWVVLWSTVALVAVSMAGCGGGAGAVVVAAPVISSATLSGHDALRWSGGFVQVSADVSLDPTEVSVELSVSETGPPAITSELVQSEAGEWAGRVDLPANTSVDGADATYNVEVVAVGPGGTSRTPTDPVQITVPCVELPPGPPEL